MAAPTGTTDTTVTTGTTSTAEGHVWERSRKGVAIPVAAGLLGLAALGIGQGWPIRGTVETELTDRSVSALDGAGVRDVDVSFEGRDGVVTGTVASAADRERVLATVRDQEGVRVAIDRLTVAGQGTADPGATAGPSATGTPSASASPSPSQTETATETATPTETATATETATESGTGTATETATPAPTPTATATATAAAVDLSVGDGTVTLEGAVPDEATRTALVEAAAGLVGAANVVDRLTVDPGVPATGLGGLAGVLTALGKDAEATVALAEGSIALDGTVGSEDARTAALGAAESVVGDAAKIRDGLTATGGGTASPGTAADEVAAKLKALPTITFKTGSSTLTPAGRRTVRKAAAILKAAPGVGVQIQGHTDSPGTARVNRELSAARARTVLITLRGLGVDPARMTSKGFGETRPAVPNTSAANRAKNRRVELVAVR
jgi:OOP family OmpA-OmpF porin